MATHAWQTPFTLLLRKREEGSCGTVANAGEALRFFLGTRTNHTCRDFSGFFLVQSFAPLVWVEK
jgi:hypothetical protein